MDLLLSLYWEFFKTGLFAVGGGMATLPFLQNMAASTGWFTTAQLADMIAVSESTPGPLGINTATYVGFTTAGVPGAVVATLGLVSPSIIIILVVAAFLKAFRDSRTVQDVFYGLRPASMGLIAASGLSVVLMAFYLPAGADLLHQIHLPGVALAAVLLILTRYCKQTKGLHPILFILASAVVGAIFSF